MKRTYLFQSERLGFRTWLPEDTTPFAALNADPIVRQYFPNTLTKEETIASINRFNRHFEQYGYGWFAVDTLSNQEFVGLIGLVWNTEAEIPGTPCAETGWRLKKEVWGNGYATEGAMRCLEYGFNELNFSSICAFTATTNKPSERIMQKIGMAKIGEFDHPKLEKGHALERHVLYEIKKEG